MYTHAAPWWLFHKCHTQMVSAAWDEPGREKIKLFLSCDPTHHSNVYKQAHKVFFLIRANLARTYRTSYGRQLIPGDAYFLSWDSGQHEVHVTLRTLLLNLTRETRNFVPVPRPWTIDMTTDKETFGESRGDICSTRHVLAFFFRKTRSSHPDDELFSQEIHLKIPLLSRGLILSNSKPAGCRASALHFFVKTPPMAFWHWAQSDKCFFQHLIPELTPTSQLESESGFQIVT